MTQAEMTLYAPAVGIIVTAILLLVWGSILLAQHIIAKLRDK